MNKLGTDAKFAIMLQIEEGMSHRVPFTIENLRDDNIVAIIDEVNNKLWVWMGKSTGLVQRRGSMRAARSLKAYGHEIANSVIGRNLEDVYDIRGDALDSDPEQKQRFDSIVRLVNTPHTYKIENILAQYDAAELGSSNIKYGLTTEQRANLVKAAIAAPSAGDDTRKIEQIIGEFRPAPPPESSTATAIPKYSQQGPSTSTSAAPMKPPLSLEPITQPVSKGKSMLDKKTMGEMRTGLIITSILTEIDEIFVGQTKKPHDVRLIKVEGPVGQICSFTIENDKITFQNGSWDKIDPEKKNKILKHLAEKEGLLP